MDNEQLWQAVLGELELSLSKANFTTWFKRTFIAQQADEEVIIAVPNTFTKAWLEQKYCQAILRALKSVTSNQVKRVVFKVESPKEIKEVIELVKVEELREVPTLEREILNERGLSNKYTFSSFIVGKNNELAHAACQAVASRPGEVYNPLFLYGGVGLGKTHLLHAIGNHLCKNYPQKKVLYVSCEKFINDFINAISSGKTNNFKQKYRQVDVLLIDDIHFLSGKEGTQEEFFHTFNELHQNNKQIVISSDRQPKEITALENRLISRFEWGMIADISLPDLETRMAILEYKTKEKNYEVEPEIIQYLANIIQNNIRELEGALNRIIAYHQLNNTKPTLETVKTLISSLVTKGIKKSLTLRQIINVVTEFYDLRYEDILGSSRKRNLAKPRQIIMYLMRQEIGASYPSIGQELGDRDHTTAIHAFKTVSQQLENNKQLQQDVTLIKQRLYS